MFHEAGLIIMIIGVTTWISLLFAVYEGKTDAEL